MSLRTKTLIVVVLALPSCSAQAPTPAPTTASSAPVVAPGGATALATPGARAPVPDGALLEPLTALGPCETTPEPSADGDVAGLVLPDGAVMTSVQDADPLTNVQGYIPQTPVQIRVFYQQHPDLRVISVEDEGFEAEVLTEAGGYRTFVKAQAVCELGSVFVAVVSPTANGP